MLSIASSPSALLTQRQLERGLASQKTSLTRLSSGMRINRPSDDAAGLAVSSSLNMQGRITSQAIRNIPDATSLLNIASGSLSELSSIVMRQKELAEQAANGVYSNAQRAALSSEQGALSKEYNRIVETTKFNGRALFSQPMTLSVEVGGGTQGGIELALGTQLARDVGNGSFTASALLLLHLTRLLVSEIPMRMEASI